ncbi:MAG: hypothetical protein U0103_28085 [Candidatus Obscuribacterales bacterium]
MVISKKSEDRPWSTANFLSTCAYRLQNGQQAPLPKAEYSCRQCGQTTNGPATPYETFSPWWQCGHGQVNDALKDTLPQCVHVTSAGGISELASPPMPQCGQAEFSHCCAYDNKQCLHMTITINSFM